MLRMLLFFFSPSLELIGSVVLQGVKEVIMEQIVSSPTISHVFKGRLKESAADKNEQREDLVVCGSYKTIGAV